jgi:hypothetical protein
MNRKLVITRGGLNLRETPKTDNVLNTLRRGSKVEVLGEETWLKVKIFVTLSAREPGRSVSGAIVPSASRSNHLVGHAIDMNLQSASGFFNSSQLKKSNLANLPDEIKDLITLAKNDEALRWGGEFNPEDPVHIDDKLNHRNPGRWDLKLTSRQ